MCGIFGRFSAQGVGDHATLCAAVQTLSHRGPDDGALWSEGSFFLGHRRLSIIDLNRGAQPMATPDGRYVVVFNGEIYNYVELRTELRDLGYRFRTASDTEVLLHGYDAWRTDLPRRLIGMFAFAIADRLEQTLFLARDRFGEKPLFLFEKRDGVTFGSELKALSALPDLPRDIDAAGLGGYLTLNYVPGERTLLRHVRRLPPATWRLYRTGRPPKGASFWTPPSQELPETTFSVSSAKERLLAALDEAIRITLRSDVPVTLFLSGGIDSSLVAARAVRQGVLKHAYCLDFPDPRYSEIANARRVSTRLGLELRSAVLKPSAMQDFLALVEHADDPLADSSSLAVWALSREVAKDYKVVITGDGGDELFGGYLTYSATRLHRRLMSGLPNPIRLALAKLSEHIPVGTSKVTFAYKLQRFLRAAHLPSSVAHFTWNGTWLPEQGAEFALTPEAAEQVRSSLTRVCTRNGVPKAPDLLALQQADIREYLPNDILAKVDRITMAHGLEARTPFLNPGFATLALSMPEVYKLPPGGQPKHILRELVRDQLGGKVANAKKQGFSIPVHQWLRYPARELVEELLSPTSVTALSMLDPITVSRAKDLHMSGRRQYGFELWGLMVLVAWNRARVSSGRLVADTMDANLRRLEFPLSIH